MLAYRLTPFPCETSDGCVHGSPLDVAERLATAFHELASAAAAPPAVWAVLQAFGGQGHWARAPNANELRASVYVSLAHGAKGVLLWLREGATPKPLVHAARLLREVRKEEREKFGGKLEEGGGGNWGIGGGGV
jgi:hypothetical protein